MCSNRYEVLTSFIVKKMCFWNMTLRTCSSVVNVDFSEKNAVFVFRVLAHI